MRRIHFLVIVVLFTSSFLHAQLTTTHGKLKLVHARATQTKAKVAIRITQPAQGQLVAGPEVSVHFQAKNWISDKNGKHFHFILDNNPFQSHFSSEPFIFRNVEPGAHVIRVFPVYPWHESVKQQEAMALVQFYVKEKSGNFPLDPTKPMMVYSTPVGNHDSNEQMPGQPHPGILVDWFLHNVSMGSKAGYFVRISVDGDPLMSMREWRPHYVQGLPPGEHRIKLELLQHGTPIQENWSSTEKTISVR